MGQGKSTVCVWWSEGGKFLAWKRKRRGGIGNWGSSELALISGMPHSLGAELNPPPRPSLSLGRGGWWGWWWSRAAEENMMGGNKHSFI